jgi:Flp pilus assembly protein TadD
MRRIFICVLLAGCASTPGPTDVGPSTLNIADAALKSGNPELALRVSRAVLSRQPLDRDAKLHEAAALFALGRTGAARVLYEQLYAVKPTIEATAGLGKCLVHENPARAADLLRAVAEKNPDNTGILTDLGVAEDLLGRHISAQKAYRHALELNPDQIPAQVDLALSLALSGEAGEASDMLRPLAKSQSSIARVRQDYGAVLALGGHANEGANVLAVDLPLSEAHEAALAYQTLGSVGSHDSR